MTPLLDSFTILIRRCARLDPEGYELTLELRPKATSGTPSGGRPSANEPQHEQRDAQEVARATS